MTQVRNLAVISVRKSLIFQSLRIIIVLFNALSLFPIILLAYTRSIEKWCSRLGLQKMISTQSKFIRIFHFHTVANIC
ncbi:hypothetical protein ARMSODRAFT_386153 [Armillaria solidipes]|uniref:Uncharacterized protein n=1 Tax=Armillaria solidipes TaxID=1076256 RepID=A0A2H3BWY7_9AGAR|nr:hypothetical protein ARMSODRAFT_386153 [Armillaria solidipes]